MSSRGWANPWQRRAMPASENRKSSSIRGSASVRATCKITNYYKNFRNSRSSVIRYWLALRGRASLARQGKPAPPEERIWGTAATVTASILNGAHIVRVHDVSEMVQVARVADCLLDPKQRPNN